MSYDQIYDYLRDKIVRVNVNNPKANWGARLLSMHMDMDMLDDYLITTIDTIQLHFNTNNESNPSGQANLSMLSMSIGKYLLEESGVEGTGRPWMVDQVRTGDLIIEAFVRSGFLTIERAMEMDKNGNMVDIGNIVKITQKWVELLRTSTRDMENILYTDAKPYTDGCLIKGEVSKRLHNKPWRRAATKLMSTAWEINTPVLEALKANKDMFMVKLPVEEPIGPDGRRDPYYELQVQRRASKESDFLVTTAKASALVGKKFYQEVEADYRGRLYYKEPFMNFQGSDLARGIMLFSEARPMTDEGKWWLAVHTANAFNQSYDIDMIPEWCSEDYRTYLEKQGLDSISVDKFTLEDRVRWTNENMEVIITAGHERVFGLDAEKPVTFLAACVEWCNISDAEARGESHLSQLPVSIDGSNNGWQHLGAISKDPRTGELVGLVATEIPRDFYVQTAKELLKIDDPVLNSMPMKHVRKGISKRGSMTRAYSAGADKIADNMWFDCQSEEFDKKYGITHENCKVWARGLIKAIDEVCPGPLETMKYMQDLIVYHLGTYEKYRDGEPATSEFRALKKESNKIRKIKKEDQTDEDVDRLNAIIEESKEFYSVLVRGNGSVSADWVTPSGFPVNYTAFQEDRFRCKGTINGKRVHHGLRYTLDIPDMHKFMCGISPNYIHAQDATHMALTIDEWNGAFGAIHDSFNTHASDIEDLLEKTKRVFVKMYDVPNFYEKIRNDITGGTDDVPQRQTGSLEIQEVHTSDYFFA